jgi:HEAT repeat protein
MKCAAQEQTMRRTFAAALTIGALTVAMAGPAAANQNAFRFALAADDDARAAQDRERAALDRERAEQDRARAEQDRARAEQDRARSARDRAENAYDRARGSIERGEWARAVDQFGALIGPDSARGDASLYWLAYSLDKLNRQAEALTRIAELVKTYPTSRWLNDAKFLEIQLRQRAGQPVSPGAQGDDDLKLLAIQGLQHMDPEQAVPMLEQLLQGPQSPRLKERALFVLAQSGSARAGKVIGDIARGNSNPDLQRKAIQYLGMNGTATNRQLLSDIYGSSADIDIKRQILRSFMMTGDKQRVLAAATTEKSPELRSEAVRQLGMMGARDELWQLYQKESSVEVKQQMLQGMMMGGDEAHLIEVANSETNVDLRRRAIQQLGMLGSRRSGDTLINLYARQTDTNIKRSVIDSLFIQGNAEALVGLAQKETDPMMKRRIVEKLAIMQSPVASKYLLDLLK